MKILVTGSAGFIGAAVCERLLARGDEVVGVDNLNTYYEVSLKHARLARLTPHPHFIDLRFDVEDAVRLDAAFAEHRPARVIHLAAQVGVRYSLENPAAYVSSNLVGFGCVLEACRHHGVEHLVYASSSSVYGANRAMPYSVHHGADHPLSLYAATKRANELMAHTYSALYRLPTTGLRFFTVYGPWGRPDMSPFRFIRQILAGEPVELYNEGHHRRDFTYVDDIVEGVIRTCDRIAEPNPAWSAVHPDPGTSSAPYRLYNIGSTRPVELLDYLAVFERCLGVEAKKRPLPLQPGDVIDTYADVDDLVADVGYRPSTTIEQGVAKLVAWYREYYGV